MKLALFTLAALVLTGCSDGMAHEHDTASGSLETGWKELLTEQGEFMLMWQASPEPLPLNESFQLSVMVHDSTGATMLPDAELLSVDASMPQHGHGMNTTPQVTANGDGSFVVDGMLFHMGGDWELVFEVAEGDTEDMAVTTVPCCE